ncbi:MAG: FAD-dependent thymidylate synthase [Deinococcota bacterium]
MARLTVDTAEAVLDHPFQVLDKGFVRLVDYLGGDARIVQAARVSYGNGTKTVREDAGLIDYLMRNWHTSPFEQVVLTFHLKMPIFIARQWLRHRTARLNEISGRYSVMRDEFYVPDEANVRYQSQRNKQGSSTEDVPIELKQQIVDEVATSQTRAYGEYSELLEADIARELARINLPLSLYTEMYWQIDLHNLFHFLRLRLDDHAQYEIRVYAEVMASIAKAVAPLAYNSFEEHRLSARNVSGGELELLRECIDTRKLKSLLEKSELRPSRQRELLTKLGLNDLEPVS